MCQILYGLIWKNGVSALNSSICWNADIEKSLRWCEMCFLLCWRQAGSWETSLLCLFFPWGWGVVSRWLGLNHVEGQVPGALQGIVVRVQGDGVGVCCRPLASHCHFFCRGYQLWICDCGTDIGDKPPQPPQLWDDHCSQSAWVMDQCTLFASPSSILSPPSCICLLIFPESIIAAVQLKQTIGELAI